MTDPTPNPLAAEPVIPAASALAMQAKGQLRLAVAALGGSLVLRHALPAAMVNDQTVDLVVGIVILAAASAWQWLRTRLVHSKLYALAVDPQVPADKARLPTPTSPANV